MHTHAQTCIHVNVYIQTCMCIHVHVYMYTHKIITLDMLNSHNIIVYQLYLNKPNKEMEELWVQIIGYPVGEPNILLI